MRRTRLVRSTVLAAALLVLPLGQAGQVPWLGLEPAHAASCKWRIEVCSEVDLDVWTGRFCVEYCRR